MRCYWMPSSYPVSFSIQKIKSTAYPVRSCLSPLMLPMTMNTGSHSVPTKFPFTLRMTNLDLEGRAMTGTHVIEVYSDL